MATADELLAAAMEAEADKTLVIDNDLRTITIPPSVKNLGVESDDDVLRLHFRMPSMYGNIDLSTFKIRINYMNAQGTGDVYAVEDAATADGFITFSWLVGRSAAAYKGDVHFIVCLKNMDKSSVITEEFNTTVATLPVLEGLETTEQVVQENPDIIEAMLQRLESLEKNSGASDEQVAASVADYFAANPVTHPVKYVESSKDSKVCLRDLETGIYLLYGYFKPFPDSNSTLIIDNMLMHLYKSDAGTYMTSLAADGEITVYEILVDETNEYGYTYARKKYNQRQTVAEITAESTDEQIPTAKAAYAALQSAGPVKRIESMEETGLRNFRELDSGTYILYGYWNPFPGSPLAIPMDNRLVTVEYQTAGSHVFVFNTLNAKVVFHEILVDETNETYGHTHTMVEINLLDLATKPKKVTIELPASGWAGEGLVYSQAVAVAGIAENSAVDLRPSAVQLQELLTAEISLTATNDAGTVTVFAIGGKPTSDYSMQALITEVVEV